MKRIVYLTFLIFLTVLGGCKQEGETDTQHPYTHKTIKGDLVVYTPEYSRIDLVCGTMPSMQADSVIFCAEAAFTGECLKEFKHSNIGGNHVSGGTFYKGVGMGRNTGAIVYYDGKYRFVYKEGLNDALKEAAAQGGMGFCQEMMIHRGKRVPGKRKDSNKNEFRALCELNGVLCVIDSKGVSTFGDFNQNLLDAGVTEALYLDMGSGWNYSWYRDSTGTAHEIHKHRIPYTTNWITFYNN